MLVDTSDLCGGFIVWYTKGQRPWVNGRYLSANWAMKDGVVDGAELKMRMVV